MLNVDVQPIRAACKASESAGISFSVLSYVKKNYPTADMDLIKKLYQEHAIAVGDGLLEHGAVEFINFLLSRQLDYCIMSYGEADWQNLKISATRLSGAPRLIVSSRVKGSYIASWQESQSQKYIIPKECFLDNQPREAKEVILIDDKIGAFSGLPTGARGYLVSPATLENGAPSNVEQVVQIDKIIDIENRRSAK